MFITKKCSPTNRRNSNAKIVNPNHNEERIVQRAESHSEAQSERIKISKSRAGKIQVF